MLPFPFAFDNEDTLADCDWTDVDPAKVQSGTPKSAHRILYVSNDEKFYAGIYACTAGKWQVSYDEDEFCTLVEGRVRLSTADGKEITYSAPESFLIPAGFQGFWEPLGNLRKFFVVYEKGVQK